MGIFNKFKNDHVDIWYLLHNLFTSYRILYRILLWCSTYSWHYLITQLHCAGNARTCFLCFRWWLLSMMIDITLYRFRIGVFGGGSVRGRVAFRNKGHSDFITYYLKSVKFYRLNTNNMHFEENIVHSQKHFIHSNMLLLLYIYFISFFTCTSLLMINSTSFSISHLVNPAIYLNWNIPSITLAYIKVAYSIIMSYALIRVFHGKKHRLHGFYKNCSRVTRLIRCIILALLILNFLLICIINPNLLNPGPTNLSVYYQNVQGLIPFYDLNKPQPKLDETKIYEINTYVNKHKPHAIMLN